jgi:hypothetical protein
MDPEIQTNWSKVLDEWYRCALTPISNHLPRRRSRPDIAAGSMEKAINE